MKSIRLQIENLEQSLHELIHLGEGDFYVNVEDVISLNKRIRAGIESLYPVEATDINEEARRCVILLEAYGQLMCQDGQDDKRRQSLLNSSARLLGKLPATLLKCRLLVSCYGEIYEPYLVDEAHAIIEGWQGRALNQEEQNLVDRLRVLEDNKL